MGRRGSYHKQFISIPAWFRIHLQYRSFATNLLLKAIFSGLSGNTVASVTFEFQIVLLHTHIHMQNRKTIEEIRQKNQLPGQATLTKVMHLEHLGGSILHLTRQWHQPVQCFIWQDGVFCCCRCKGVYIPFLVVICDLKPYRSLLLRYLASCDIHLYNEGAIWKCI